MQHTKTQQQLMRMVLLVLGMAIGAGAVYYFQVFQKTPASIVQTTLPTQSGSKDAVHYEQFESDEQAVVYVEHMRSYNSTSGGFGVATAFDAETDIAMQATAEKTTATPERVSETNVQVVGIDEPDLVKTDGQRIYMADQQYGSEWFTSEGSEGRIIAEQQQENVTRIINAFPPDALQSLADIDTAGQLLLHENTLVVIGNERVAAYDVRNPQEPQQSWQYTFGERSVYDDARLIDDTLYLIARTSFRGSAPCPVVPLTGDKDITVPCTDIFYPTTPTPSDATFTLSKLNVTTGREQESLTFIGSTDEAVIYMSSRTLYVAQSRVIHQAEIYTDFALQPTNTVLPTAVVNRIRALEEYDISLDSRMQEISAAIDQHAALLSEKKASAFYEDLNKAVDAYYTEHKREVELTHITAIDTDSLDIGNTGVIPGYVLNQFSMDEHDGYLRVTSTVGERFWWFGGTEDDSTNDLYVLDENMGIAGSLRDMGDGERIYSTRFVGDKGYMVTFRQTDPFFVFDLSDPRNPLKVGELKIPGFSSYLHPVSENRILGVGMDEGRVKVSLFNVEDPSEPYEADNIILDDYSTEILSTHHAFLNDPDHEIVFIPGSTDGTVISYTQDTLSKKYVAKVNPLRALYIDDFLYVIGRKKIVVVNEKNWKKVSTFSYVKNEDDE